MAQAQTIDVARLIDDRKITWFNWGLVILSFFIILLDGYDIGAIAIAAPTLRKLFDVTDPKAIGFILTASLAGILFGSPILGYIGDRWGRKIAVILSSLIFGGFTLAVVWAGSWDSIIYLRFCAGLGIGGLLPNLIALNAEYAPKNFRATLVIIMFAGITFGGALPGFVGQWLMPDYGWTIIFWIGGIIPVLMAVLAAFWLPESVKFLVVKGGRDAEVAAVMKRVEPNLSVPAGTRFVIAADEKQYKGFSPAYLFRDGLQWITPLLWVCFATNLMAFYFINSWLPLVLSDAHASPTMINLAVPIFQIGGTLGGLSLSRPIDLKGFVPVAILFVLAIPVVALIGFSTASVSWLAVQLFLAGFCSLGLQFGLNASSAMIYPTAFRSSGSGWAFAIGRFGSVAGPILGGYLLAYKMPLSQLFMIAAIPYIIGSVAVIVMTRLYFSHFRGYGLGRRDAIERGAAD